MEEVTSHSFDVESESFQLRNIMEAPLLKFREDIEVHTIFCTYIQMCAYYIPGLIYTASLLIVTSSCFRIFVSVPSRNAISMPN